MRKLTFILTLSLVSLFPAHNSRLHAQQAASRPVVAVLDFNSAQASTAAQAASGRQLNVGEGISRMLIDRLMSDDTYRVVTRDEVMNTLNEENVSYGGQLDPATAAKIGHLLHADAAIVGDVTQFQTGSLGGESRKTQARPGTAKAPQVEAVVAIKAQIIDTNTGRIIASTSCRGVSRGPAAPLPTASGRVDMQSTAFAQTTIGRATLTAVNELAKGLEGESKALPKWAPPPPTGQITDASTPNIVINVGSAAGLKVGDQMLVTRLVHVVTAEGTDSEVGAIEDQVGVLTLTSVHAGSAVGRFSGSVTPKAGDLVKPLQ